MCVMWWRLFSIHSGAESAERDTVCDDVYMYMNMPHSVLCSTTALAHKTCHMTCPTCSAHSAPHEAWCWHPA